SQLSGLRHCGCRLTGYAQLGGPVITSSLQPNVHRLLRCTHSPGRQPASVKSVLTEIVVNDNIRSRCGTGSALGLTPQDQEQSKKQSVVRPVRAREDSMLRLATLTTVLTALLCAPAVAEKDGVLRVGVMNDMSGVYSDFQGAGSVLAAQLAVEDFAKLSKRKVEVLTGDHLNKPDVGSAIARRWLHNEGVDQINDLPHSAGAAGGAQNRRRS